jgi:DNA-directed RNA polymerase specialized sigma24 family protein
MDLKVSSSDLHFVLHEADFAARRLLRQLRLPRHDLDDLRQDLLADLIARLRGFDPERGSLGAFSGIVLANRSTRIANKVKRERRLYGPAPVSLDETISESEGLARGDIIGEDEGLRTTRG